MIFWSNIVSVAILYCNYLSVAEAFFHGFNEEQEDYHQDDLIRLSAVTKKDHMKHSEIMVNFRSVWPHSICELSISKIHDFPQIVLDIIDFGFGRNNGASFRQKEIWNIDGF